MILMDFSYFFLLFSGFLGGVWGAVLGISAISATFSALFRIFGWGLGCCFGDFCDFRVKSKFVCKFIFQLCGFIYATFIFKRFD